MSLKVEFRYLIEIFNYLIQVFSDVVFLELIPLMKFSVLESPCFPMTACLNSLSFKTEYGKKCFSAKHTVPMRVLTHKIDVSLFIDLIALYMNP